MRLSGIILSFLKVGATGFGGGSALIPIVEKELVVRHGSIKPDEYVKHTVVANITPGALPVKLGATCGYQMAGSAASALGAYCVALPGTPFTVLIIALFSVLGQQAVDVLTYASLGITVFIVFLLSQYILKTMRDGSLRTNVLICATAACLTIGKEIREVLEFALHIEDLGSPVFDISMIQLMIISIYLIVFTKLAQKRGYVFAAFALSVLYAFFNGKLAAGWAIAGIAKLVLILIMVISVLVAFLARPRSRERKQKLHIRKGILIAISVFLGLPILTCVVLMALNLLPGGFLGFIGNAAVSTITSFGGGEAYVAIADGVFVQGGYVPSDVFYNQIVPVANALPGPILMAQCRTETSKSAVARRIRTAAFL